MQLWTSKQTNVLRARQGGLLSKAKAKVVKRGVLGYDVRLAMIKLAGFGVHVCHFLLAVILASCACCHAVTDPKLPWTPRTLVAFHATD